MKKPNPFKLFNLQPSSQLMSQNHELLTHKALKEMYLRMQAACHPDNFALGSVMDQQAASQKSAQLAQAFRVLSDDLSRVKCWLGLQGIDIESQTVQPDMASFELQMQLNETLDQLDATDIVARQQFNDQLNALRTQIMSWFRLQSTDRILHDCMPCLHRYGQLAMVTRLSQKLKDISF